MTTQLPSPVFLRQICSTSSLPLSWLLLHPGQPRLQTLWTRWADRFTVPERTEAIARILESAPLNGRPATKHSSWVRDLTPLLSSGSDADDFIVLPIVCDKRRLACVGWDRGRSRTADFAVNAKKIREVFRNLWGYSQLEVEHHALHWMVSCGDRAVACVRPDGTLVRANPAATDVLMGLQYGPRHYFRSGAPTIPKALFLAVKARTTGQIRINEECTVRFEELPRTSVCALPLIGIEFYVERSLSRPQPLTRLTAVEREIYELLVAGLTYREMAIRRGSAFATVKNQASSVLNKLGVSKRHQLLTPPASLPAVQLRNPGMKGSTASIK